MNMAADAAPRRNNPNNPPRRGMIKAKIMEDLAKAAASTVAALLPGEQPNMVEHQDALRPRPRPRPRPGDQN